MMLNEIIDARRSVRKYLNKPVDDAALAQVLEAGRLAPSARNRQAWHFTVVKDQDLRAKLVEACCGQQMVAEAPLALVIWFDEESMMGCDQSAASIDGSIALSFMMLKATELGLGTCWLGAFYADKVKAVLGLAEKSVVVAVTPLGWPGETPQRRPRKAIEEISDLR